MVTRNVFLNKTFWKLETKEAKERINLHPQTKVIKILCIGQVYELSLCRGSIPLQLIAEKTEIEHNFTVVYTTVNQTNPRLVNTN